MKKILFLCVLLAFVPAGRALAQGMVIGNKSFVTVIGEASIKIDGTGTITIKSAADGTGSFIGSATDITATVERYLVDYVTVPDFRFHLLSSPVLVQSILSEFMDITSPAITDFYAFDEPTNLWINTRVAGSYNEWNTGFENNFIVGKGYLVAYPDPVIKEFTGTLNSYVSPLVHTCTNTAGLGNGWNLLGNPFPSAIDWGAVSLGDGMDNALYYYDNAQQKYRYYIQFSGDNGTTTIGSGSQYIPAMQGFMVHAKTSGTQTVSIDNGDRLHAAQDVFYKSTNTAPGSLSLKVAGGSYEDEVFIHFNQAATTAFDGSFDAFKLRSYNSAIPMIYTVGSDGSELAINGLPELDEQTVILFFF